MTEWAQSISRGCPSLGHAIQVTWAASDKLLGRELSAARGPRVSMWVVPVPRRGGAGRDGGTCSRWWMSVLTSAGGVVNDSFHGQCAVSPRTAPGGWGEATRRVSVMCACVCVWPGWPLSNAAVDMAIEVASLRRGGRWMLTAWCCTQGDEFVEGRAGKRAQTVDGEAKAIKNLGGPINVGARLLPRL